MKYPIALLAMLLVTPSFGAEFRGMTASTLLGDPDRVGQYSVQVTAISGDGSTIGGTSTQIGLDFDCAFGRCGVSAFVWSLDAHQPRELETLPYMAHQAIYPTGVAAFSADGSIALVTHDAVLHIESALHHGDDVLPFRTPTIGEAPLYAGDMSAGGSVVVGSVGEVPYRWTAAEGLQTFADLPDDANLGATAISADASTILLDGVPGRYELIVAGDPVQNALRWTASDGAVELEPLAGFASSNAVALSHDGVVVVGNSVSHSPIDLDPDRLPTNRATAWIGSEVIALDTTTGTSSALDVSADGTMIVGTLDPTNPQTDAFFLPEAMLWREGQAYRIQDVLADEYGLGGELAGWSLTSATAISDNGRVIAGEGIAPDGQRAAWVTVLAVPEPPAWGMFVTGLAAIGLWKSTGRKEA